MKECLPPDPVNLSVTIFCVTCAVEMTLLFIALGAKFIKSALARRQAAREFAERCRADARRRVVEDAESATRSLNLGYISRAQYERRMRELRLLVADPLPPPPDDFLDNPCDKATLRNGHRTGKCRSEPCVREVCPYELEGCCYHLKDTGGEYRPPAVEAGRIVRRKSKKRK